MDAVEFDLETFLPFRLNRAAEFIALRFAAAYKAEYGLTRPEWRTLAALGSSGRMTATAVGAHSTMHKTKVSRAVFTLEERRWLKRTQDEDDRRVEHLELTAAGHNAYRELTRLAADYSAELARLIGEDGLQALSVGLNAVEAAMARRRR
ncbi:MAG TPA: MarR family winged helix-turn-helix transcriptional regulator [Pararhizobium sp.]|uniref:MarR family winged helix-turn-helix transcriptional regulator n=1 Tax=Pararhizobium sp. TaxID=1977563 RepID=UPI002C94A9A0|nr:MarR family winged helix-turn-helix transcriptional regulator [Pararhizobium sp.]HTO34034.1 MarR family winged helix-turn-helix transcriptional regulator [Pararhizobium sp.]